MVAPDLLIYCSRFALLTTQLATKLTTFGMGCLNYWYVSIIVPLFINMATAATDMGLYVWSDARIYQTTKPDVWMGNSREFLFWINHLFPYSWNGIRRQRSEVGTASSLNARCTSRVTVSLLRSRKWWVVISKPSIKTSVMASVIKLEKITRVYLRLIWYRMKNTSLKLESGWKMDFSINVLAS